LHGAGFFVGFGKNAGFSSEPDSCATLVCKLSVTHSVYAECVYLISAEAVHLANLMCATGYIFPIDDHILVVKNDGAYYRFQVRHSIH